MGLKESSSPEEKSAAANACVLHIFVVHDERLEYPLETLEDRMAVHIGVQHCIFLLQDNTRSTFTSLVEDLSFSLGFLFRLSFVE